MAGRSHYSSVTLFSALPHVNDGKLVALAVAVPQRAPQLPDVPTLAETFPDFKRPENSTGILAPAGLAPDIVTRLNTEIARIMRQKETRERLYSFGAQPIDNTPAEFAAYINAEIAKWARVVKSAGIRVD